MTTSLHIKNLVDAALTGYPGTDAKDRVYRPGALPTQTDQYPNLRTRLTAESRQSLGRGGPPEFTTLCTVRIIGEVSAPASIADVTSSTIEAQLWALKRQVEVAVINSYPLFSRIQQLASIQAQLAYTSEAATHLAGIQIDMAFEFYEGPEDFAPIETDDLTDADITASNFTTTGIDIDIPH